MNVKELIEKLSKHDPELPVEVLSGGEPAIISMVSPDPDCVYILLDEK